MEQADFQTKENIQDQIAALTTNIATSGGHSYSYQKPIIQNKSPPGRGGCSCIYADGKLVVFGGHYYSGGDKFTYLNDIWLLDIDKLTWHKVSCSGEIPGPRYGHSTHILGSRMFIFGGKGPGEIVYKDVFFLDLLDWIWVPVNTLSDCPSPRFFQASEIVGRKIAIHGGWDGKEVFNDLWIFNTDSFVWMQPRTVGFGPTPRYGHSLTLTLDGRLFVFGGCSINSESGVPKYNDDIRQLDTDTMVWTRPRVSGQIPTGRYGHSATLLSEGRILLYGGWGKGGCQNKESTNNPNAQTIQILDTKSMTWFVPRRLSNKQVKHLYNHAACRSSASTVFLFGGFDSRQALNEFYLINLENDSK